MQLILEIGCNVFFIIPEFIKRNRNKIKEREKILKENTKINYNYTAPKKVEFKGIVYLIIYLIVYCISLYIRRIYSAIYKGQVFIINGEGTKSLKIVYLVILYKLFENNEFYRHQYLSMIIIILMGIVRFIMNIKKYNWEFIFPNTLIAIFMSFLSPLFDMLLFFMMKYYMKYKYYSPYFICFMLGIVFGILESLTLIIFRYIDYEENEVCKILSKETFISGNKTIFILIIYSINQAFYVLVETVTINNFTVFHLMLLFAFGRIVQNLIDFSNYNIYEHIIIISTSLIEIISILVFVELIILNFCGCNYNIKKNIIFRADEEIGLLGEVDDDSSNDDNTINEDSLIKEDNKDDNSVY